MRVSTFILFGVLLVAGGAYWYQATAHYCPVPLSYRLGEIDSSFNITEAAALERIKAAEALWEEVAERELFHYQADAAFTIDFVFDDRQETINTEASERATLDDKRDYNESLVAQLDVLQAEYTALRDEYEARMSAYETELTAYNQTVQTYNDQGGAPTEVFGQLEETRTALETEAATLDEIAQTINQLAGQITELGDRSNAQIESYNREVNRYNNRYGYEREFTQGDYQGDSIHIYTFTSDAELETVLAHEFGHALGIGHVEDNAALMYYLMDEPHASPQLTAADLAALQQVCGETETLGQSVRHQIRQLLRYLN